MSPTVVVVPSSGVLSSPKSSRVNHCYRDTGKKKLFLFFLCAQLSFLRKFTNENCIKQ